MNAARLTRMPGAAYLRSVTTPPASTTGFARPQYLVDTAWLARHLDDPGVRVLESTVLVQPAADAPGGFRFESGRAQWAEGHIPGAGFVDVQDELSDKSSHLRFMMPPAAQFAEVMGRHGVGDGVQVVLYDRFFSMWAARVWWMLRASGFDAAVLDGGWTKWKLEGRPVATDDGVRPARQFTARPRPALFTDKAGVLAALGKDRVSVVCALPEPMYRGAVGGLPRVGHIAGTPNVPAPDLVDPATQAFLPADELRARFTAAGALDSDRVIVYCNNGIASTSDALVLTLLGHDDVTVYDASLAEWTADPTLPMETKLLDQTTGGWDLTSTKYDEHMPHILRAYALECIRLGEVAPNHEVLDLAAGTGILTMDVAPQVARVVAVDFSPKMIEILKDHAERAGHKNVVAQVMDGQNLDLPDQSFDRVFSNFGLIYFMDRVKGFAEIYRVLRPGGRAVVSAWSSPDRFEAFGLLFGAMAQAVPNMPPRPPSPPPPLSLADPTKFAAEMRAGGFERVRVESITTYWEVPSPEMVWTRMEHSAPPMIDMLKRVGPQAAAKARDHMLGALRRRFGDGPVKLPCEAHYGIGER